MAESKRAENSQQGEREVAAAGRQSDGKASPKSTLRFVEGNLDLSGRVLGDFCLLRKLGKGGMAEVYLAEQTSLQRQVAIKIMRSEFVTDPQYVKRFRHEASAAGGLNHPNIVQVYMVGEQDGIHFISQEYVQGRNLKEFITRKGPLEVPIALHILKQVAAALQIAAEKGIVHRDIKPENILLTRKGEAKVADFGLAQLTLGGERIALTQEGVTMGTPLYMSPEQVSGKALDARSDIYSLGVMAFHMLAGQPPFTGETALAVAVKHLNEEPPSLKDSRPDVPAGVRNLIERMMAKKKEDRPADAQAVLNEIKQLMRQATGKEAPVLETAFRPSASGTSQLGSLLMKRPVRLQLGWLAGACVLMATCTAGIGWAMRTSDPFKTAVPAGDAKVRDLGTPDAQFLHAQGNPTSEADWYAAKAKLSDVTDPAHLRMRDRCDLNLAMIYLHTRRVEQARQIFSDFASSTDLWRRAHGIAGKAIVEDLQGDQADRKAIAQYAEQAEALVRQLDRDGRLDPVVETALRDVLQRGEKLPR